MQDLVIMHYQLFDFQSSFLVVDGSQSNFQPIPLPLERYFQVLASMFHYILVA